MTFKTEIRICERCGKEYNPKQHNQKYCHNEYCRQYKTNLKTAVFKCKVCGTKFKPKRGGAKYCSNKCKHFIKNKHWRNFYKYHKGYEPVKKINCVVCGEKFLRKSIRQIYCKNKECKLEYLRKKALKKYYKYKDKILERRKNSPEYCIMNKLRMRINCAVKSQGTYKADKTVKLVGCTVKQLKQYLEEQFEEKMSWENYGKKGWSIDHIIPCASFDLTKKEEQYQCFHYTNLMPRWSTTIIAEQNGSSQIGNKNKNNKILNKEEMVCLIEN